MAAEGQSAELVRPQRVSPTPVPPLPAVDLSRAEEASTTFSHYRTELSNHRTGLSEHRTDLSEYRTDLSTNRTHMSMRRTGMSIHRTRMSADRTLMSIIRTALSLIGFGFTIYQVFEKAHQAGAIPSARAPGNFGLSLIVLGVMLLAGGLVNHIRFARELRHTRANMSDQGLIFGESVYPLSVTLVVALLLLLIGVAAVATVVFGVSLFG